MKPALKIFTIHAFHFWGVIGYIIGLLTGIAVAQRVGSNPLIVLWLGAVSAFTFFALALLVKAITNRENIVYYHHEIAILTTCAFTLAIMNRPVLHYLDITLLGIAIFLAFGRIGCFSVGCCHGRPHRWGVRYGKSHVKAGFPYYFENVTLYPIQLIESFIVFATAIIGAVLIINAYASGTFLVFYTCAYGSARFTLEFFRGDPARPYYRGLSEAQWTTLVLVSLCLLFSMFGRTPFYGWQIFIFTSILIISVFVITNFKKWGRFLLFLPRHYQQLLTGMDSVGRWAPGIVRPVNIPISVGQTDLGLCFSFGHTVAQNETVLFFTFSSQNPDFTLNKKIILILSEKLRHHYHLKPRATIIDKGNGIFHLTFNQL